MELPDCENFCLILKNVHELATISLRKVGSPVLLTLHTNL